MDASIPFDTIQIDGPFYKLRCSRLNSVCTVCCSKINFQDTIHLQLKTIILKMYNGPANFIVLIWIDESNSKQRGWIMLRLYVVAKCMHICNHVYNNYYLCFLYEYQNI